MPSIILKRPPALMFMGLFLPVIGPFEGRDVEFLHLEENPDHAGARFGGAAHQCRQLRRHDLPRESELVFEPVALLCLPPLFPLI